MENTKKIQIDLIFSFYYFERILYLLKYNDTFLMVYRRSGMNGGNKGKILPFHFLQDTLPRFGDARNGVVPGYIFKKFYFDKSICYHGKNLSNFSNSSDINSFLDDLEIYLPSIPHKEQDFSDVLIYAKSFNDVCFEYIHSSTDLFDWQNLKYSANQLNLNIF